MVRHRVGGWFLVTGLVWTAAHAAVSTGDGVQLDVTGEGQVRRLAIDGTALPLVRPGGFSAIDFARQPEPVNLVPNPGFEDGAKGWTLAPTQTLDPEVYHSGKAAVRLSVPGPERASSDLRVVVPAKPRTTYRVGMWYRRHQAVAGSGGGPGAYASCQDDQGNHLGPYQTGGTVPVRDDTWTLVSWTVTTEPGTTRLLLRGDLFRTTGTIWLDDFFINEVADPVTQPFSGTAAPRGEQLVWSGGWPQADLTLSATLKAERDHFRVDGVVADTSGQDRAIGLHFGLPLDLGGWTWWQDAEDRQPIAADGGRYSNTYRCESGTGRCSIYPWSAVSSAQAGLSVALPLSPGPRVYVLQHDQARRELSLTFCFGLAKDAGRNPSRAPFSFVIYRHQPAWGLRAAMQRYYELFPESFVKRPTYEGYLNYGFLEVIDPANHTLRTAGATLPDVSDYGEGYGFVWHLHGCYDYHQVASTDPKMPEDVTVLGWMDKLMAAEKTKPGYYTPVAETVKKLVHDSNGRIRYIFDTQYWRAREGYNHTDQPGWGLNFRVHEDPDIAPWCAEKTRQELARYAAAHPQRQPFDACLTADAIEGYSSNEVGLNYRREHFAATLPPLTFGAGNLKPAIVNTIWDFHHKCWWPLSQQHQVITYGNGNVPSCFFTMPYTDLAMVEGRWPANQRGAEERFWRATAHHKLWRYWCDSTAWYERPGDRDSVLRHLRHGLAGAIFPAAQAVQASTSDLESYRPWYRQYVPAIEELSAAGWEPVPHARATGGAVVERFGDGAHGTLHLTLRNYAAAEQSVTLTLDRAALGLPATGELVAVDLLDGGPSATVVPPTGLPAKLAPDGTRAFWIGTRAQQAARGLALSRAVLDKIARGFAAELSTDGRALLDRGRSLCRTGASADRAAALAAAEELQRLADQLPAAVPTKSPVDLAKLLLRLRAAAAQVPAALVAANGSAARLVENVPPGDAAMVRWPLTSGVELANPRGDVLSAWPEAAGRLTVDGPAGLTAVLPVPAAPSRAMLPYLLRLRATVDRQPVTLCQVVDVTVGQPVEVTVTPQRADRGSETRLTVRLTNRRAEAGEVKLVWAAPRSARLTPAEATVALPAKGTAELPVVLSVDRGASIGQLWLRYQVSAGTPLFASSGVLPVRITEGGR